MTTPVKHMDYYFSDALFFIVFFILFLGTQYKSVRVESHILLYEDMFMQDVNTQKVGRRVNCKNMGSHTM